jgi:hypothetical protein
MTNSENIIQFGPNAYSKPATGLNILRETVMGRELFDFSFREYARRWAFKHPTPADLFRTMEDASGEDLDWFWRGWYYGIEACDIAIDTVKLAVMDPSSTPLPGADRPQVKRGLDKPLFSGANAYDDISKIRNRNDKKIQFQTDVDTSLRDFYWRYTRGLEPYDSTVTFPVPSFAGNLENLTEEEKEKYKSANLYEITFLNKGGLVMPIILEFTFADGSKQTERIPAQIWRKNENKVTKVFMTTQKAVKIQLDPLRETADINESNNTWPAIDEPSKFSIFKAGAARGRGQSSGMNPMQNALGKSK